jgi:hypothetical protein
MTRGKSFILAKTFILEYKLIEIGAQSLQSIQGSFTPAKYLRTNLFNIKVKEESIPHEDNNATLERINTIRNPLFEVVEQQQLQSETPTFVAR